MDTLNIHSVRVIKGKITSLYSSVVWIAFQNYAISFLFLAEEGGKKHTSCNETRKKVGNSGTKGRLFAEYIFSFIYKLHQKAWNSSTRSKKTIDNNKIKKEEEDRPGVNCKTIVFK